MSALVAAGAAVVALLALSACGSAEETAPKGNFTLEDARAFDSFPLYYAGDRFDGLPLVAVLRRDDTAKYVSFVYGECVSSEYDQGCAPPAEIQVWPRAARNLESYSSSAPGVPTLEETTVRGLPAAFVDSRARLEIFAEGSTVVLFSDSRERTLELAQALRCVTGSDQTLTGRCVSAS